MFPFWYPILFREPIGSICLSYRIPPVFVMVFSVFLTLVIKSLVLHNAGCDNGAMCILPPAIRIEIRRIDTSPKGGRIRFINPCSIKKICHLLLKSLLFVLEYG